MQRCGRCMLRVWHCSMTVVCIALTCVTFYCFKIKYRDSPLLHVLIFCRYFLFKLCIHEHMAQRFCVVVSSVCKYKYGYITCCVFVIVINYYGLGWLHALCTVPAIITWRTNTLHVVISCLLAFESSWMRERLISISVYTCIYLYDIVCLLTLLDWWMLCAPKQLELNAIGLLTINTINEYVFNWWIFLKNLTKITQNFFLAWKVISIHQRKFLI